MLPRSLLPLLLVLFAEPTIPNEIQQFVAHFNRIHFQLVIADPKRCNKEKSELCLCYRDRIRDHEKDANRLSHHKPPCVGWSVLCIDFLYNRLYDNKFDKGLRLSVDGTGKQTQRTYAFEWNLEDQTIVHEEHNFTMRHVQPPKLIPRRGANAEIAYFEVMLTGKCKGHIVKYETKFPSKTEFKETDFDQIGRNAFEMAMCDDFFCFVRSSFVAIFGS